MSDNVLIQSVSTISGTNKFKRKCPEIFRFV